MNADQVYHDASNTGSYQIFPMHHTFPSDDFVHRHGPDGARQLAFGNARDAKNWLGAVKVQPHIDPATDPTIDMLDASRQVWVAAMVDAVYDIEHCKDGAKMKAHFVPTKKSSFQNLEVEAACHMLLDVLIQHCRHGFRGMRRFNLLETRSHVADDGTVDCRDRAVNVIVALRTWKSICKGMIEESDKKWQLVNAPLSMMHRKVVECEGNSKKKSNFSAGKEARNELEAIQQSGGAATRSPSFQVTPMELLSAYPTAGYDTQPLQKHTPAQDRTFSATSRGLELVSRDYTPDSVQQSGEPQPEPISIYRFADFDRALLTTPTSFHTNARAYTARFSYLMPHTDAIDPSIQSGLMNTQRDFDTRKSQTDGQNNTDYFDHRRECLNQDGLAAPFPNSPIFDHANSPTINTQPHYDAHTSVAQDFNHNQNIHVAHNVTRVPQPVIHGNYPHIGCKRTREELVDATPESRSRRMKLDGNGSYSYDDAFSNNGK
jgi:hypothetical protein